ncbi:YjdF family protein [Lactiplantibacillus paraplantarum]|uniref:YjdF family protein n=1 Tax=Lactiplantibacillus paraplantarum TaxID=60520 RepID=UPI0020745DB2|nr:YjdF family protein [Lactiplantibacillus paraplantarum]
MINRCKLTVFFDQQFYRGVFERWSTDGYQVARVTFGTQNPSEPQIGLLIQNRWSTLQWTTASAVAQQQLVREYRHVVRQSHQRHASFKPVKATQMLKLEHQRHLVMKKRRQRRAQQEHAQLVRAKRLAKHRAQHRGH